MERRSAGRARHEASRQTPSLPRLTVHRQSISWKTNGGQLRGLLERTVLPSIETDNRPALHTGRHRPRKHEHRYKLESLERMYLICEINGSFDSCNLCKRPAVYMRYKSQNSWFLLPNSSALNVRIFLLMQVSGIVTASLDRGRRRRPLPGNQPMS